MRERISNKGISGFFRKPRSTDRVPEGVANLYSDSVTIASLQTQINSKQATLVSGTNIKTINGSSILGAGDLVVSGGLTQQQIMAIGSLRI